MTKTILTEQAIVKQFDAWAPMVLTSVAKIARVPREKGERQRYETDQSLPTMDEYRQIRDAKFTTTIEDLVSDAIREFEELKGELEDWLSNLPEQFQNGDKGEQLQSAIDALDSACSEPEIPDSIRFLQTVHRPPIKPTSSRQARLAEACAMLSTAIDALGDVDDDDERHEDASTLQSELENLNGEAESVEMPTMFS